MHFAKRLRSEADRKWLQHYIDYKLLKRSIRQDVDALDSNGSSFNNQLNIELEKVAAFYAEQEANLESHLQSVVDNDTVSPAHLAALHAEVQDLRKYVVLNYVAVVKAVKKRNRHLKNACGPATLSIRAVSDILAKQHFFTSVRLAAMATRTEIFAQEQMQAMHRQKSNVLEDFTCPICLNPLRSPVVLSCAHRFCWGCLISLASTFQRSYASQTPMAIDQDDQKHSMQCDEISPASPTTVIKPAVWESEMSDDDTATVATFSCPCCRKEQFILDLDKLQVDPHLDAFMQRLEHHGGDINKLSSITATATITADQSIREEAQQRKDTVLSMRLKSQAVPINSDAAATPPLQTLKEMPKPLLAASEAIEAQQHNATTQSMDIVPPSPSPLPQMMVSAIPGEDKPLLPPQPISLQHRLTICLDLDGTLVTTFTPKRAPTLPPMAVSYIVGRGGTLNPGGVFVVERPGLGNFLQRITAFAEVVIFTAGLEDYAAPICDEIERRYGKFDYRLYRPATVPSDVYPCIKDLSRLGRDIRRCVLVDDTPLAFFRQPDNGIPVLQFRGDIDDRMLEEAIGPLLEALVHEQDVTRALARRFNMKRWFAAQGLPAYSPQKQQKQQQQQQHAMDRRNLLHRAPSVPAMLPGRAAPGAAAPSFSSTSPAGLMLVCDFDKTLMDCDTGEALCDHLAPELTSLLTQVESHSSGVPQQQQQLPTYVPVTNTVLSEMQRRGISQDQIFAALRSMAAEAFPSTIIDMIKSSHQRKMEVHILSDANSLFIGSILAAAKVNHLVKSVITNPARFEAVQVAVSQEQDQSNNTNQWFFGSNTASIANTHIASKQQQQQHRLVVAPCHDHASMGHHGCPLCPSNLCKGKELEALRNAQQTHRRVVYCGDGANDFCAVLRLGKGDVALARGGFPLEKLINQHRNCVNADVVVWNTHDELARLIDGIASC